MIRRRPRRMPHRRAAPAFTLIEMVLAITIASVIAVIGIRYVQPRSGVAASRACELARAIVRREVQHKNDRSGRVPTRLDLIASDPNEERLRCPETEREFGISRSGEVTCRDH